MVTISIVKHKYLILLNVELGTILYCPTVVYTKIRLYTYNKMIMETLRSVKHFYLLIKCIYQIGL